MRTIVCLAVFAMILSTMAIAGHEVAVLDGTSWKVEVEPDAMAKDKGEKQFKETLTFADGSLTLSAPKVGSEASPYTMSKAGEKDWTFKAERDRGRRQLGLDRNRARQRARRQADLDEERRSRDDLHLQGQQARLSRVSI